MSEPRVITNNVPRPIVYGFELSEKEKEEFDYMTEEEIECAEFFRYRGWTYYLGDFMRVENAREGELLYGWDGIHTDSFFSAIVLKWRRDDFSYGNVKRIEIDPEWVIVGLYLC